MSRTPGNLTSESSRSQYSLSQSVNNQNTRLQQGAVSSSKSADRTQPRSPPQKSWHAPSQQASMLADDVSQEEDELSEELPLHLRSSRSPRSQRAFLAKRKSGKDVAHGSSSKRTKRADDELSASEKALYPTKAPNRGPSPRALDDTRSTTADSRSGEPGGELADSASERVLSLDEIDTFLDLIYKHHPDPMTAETMRQSVDALYHDWEQYCARRRVPVRLTKKPLMDEYGKIFNGVYGSDFQAKAKSIAEAVFQRSASEQDDERRDNGDRNSAAKSMTDGDTDDDDEEDKGDGNDSTFSTEKSTAAGKSGQSQVPPSGKGKVGKGQVAAGADEPGTPSKSSIAQKGRNGLAVLPPGLFDILRTHLRDDILASIMPSVRNELTEQTRELFLQNQDLFGRLKEMEDRIRNQDLWIRHLLSRDPLEPGASPVGPPATFAGMPRADPASASAARPRPLTGGARESSSFGRPPPQHGFRRSDGDSGDGVPIGDYNSGGRPMSPRQHSRDGPRHFPEQGMTGPHPLEGGASSAMTVPPSGSGQGLGPGPVVAFESVRWQGTHRAGPPRDRAPTDGRPSYVGESPHRRPGSGPAETQQFHPYTNEPHDPYQMRYEPHPDAVQYMPLHRHSIADPRRLSTVSGGSVVPAGQRGSAPGPSQPSMGPAAAIGAHDDFRRSGPPTVQREPVPPPSEPSYDIRRPSHPNLPASHSEPYFSSGHETIRTPQAPRSMAVGSSPVQIPKNKRGRPSKAEMANNRVGELGGGGGAQPRPYMS
uniref:Uncharacterized protein n=1 Tax=Kalmanozyma brasiliensis (strain GHG001) TaxID=1365824 RepID=V5GWF3_KALBG